MSIQNIHNAMGTLAYAMAKADGEIQDSEKVLIKMLAQKEFELGDFDVEWIERMFLRLEKDKIKLSDAYSYALDILEANRYEFDFDASIRNKCINFMQKISEEFKSTTIEEQDLLARFIKDTTGFLNT